MHSAFIDVDRASAAKDIFRRRRRRPPSRSTMSGLSPAERARHEWPFQVGEVSYVTVKAGYDMTLPAGVLFPPKPTAPFEEDKARSPNGRNVGAIAGRGR